MIVVIEGPDGAGKTTLADKVQAEGEKIGLVVNRVHSAVPRDPAREYERIIDRANDSRLHVVDRLHFGELVYGFTRRQSPAFGLRTFTFLETCMRHANGVTCVLAPEHHDLLRAHWQRLENTPEKIAEERERFVHLAQLAQLAGPRYVRLIEGYPPEGTAQELVDFVIDEKEKHRWK